MCVVPSVADLIVADAAIVEIVAATAVAIVASVVVVVTADARADAASVLRVVIARVATGRVGTAPQAVRANGPVAVDLVHAVRGRSVGMIVVGGTVVARVASVAAAMVVAVTAAEMGVVTIVADVRRAPQTSVARLAIVRCVSEPRVAVSGPNVRSA